MWRTSHFVTYFVLTAAQGVGSVSYFVRQIKLRYIETEFWVSCSTSLFCTASLVKIITNGWIVKVSLKIYIPCNSQSSTVSQKVLQGDNHLWKDVIISHSKIPSIRHLKVMFPYRNLSSTRQTIYPFVLRIMWLSVDKIVANEEDWV